ncbi:hypothetical protein H5T51_08320 [Candidatus Bathyarchaeota archaeon]|nr:hypothetical protein [Candidatus Bathyarchaeota archaeon]
MDAVKVLVYGVGSIGGAIANFLLEKPGASVVGAVDIDDVKVGRDLGKVLNLNRATGIVVSSNIDDALSDAKADIAIHAMTSRLREAYPQIAELVRHSLNVVSTCEELSYPYYSEPELAAELDKLAKQHNVTVLGTGINPGFVMDTLVIALTAACQEIDRIDVYRVIDASKRRLPFQRKIGVGLTPEEFRRAVAEKCITGHVGLEQSIAMIASALSWTLDEIVTADVEAIIAEEDVEKGVVKVKAGSVIGIRQRATGVVDGKEAIQLDFRAYLGAEEYDAVTIHGVPEIRQRIQPCVHGDAGTVAVVVNVIPKVLNAPAGLLTMKDLPLPSAALGDLSRFVTSFRCKL